MSKPAFPSLPCPARIPHRPPLWLRLTAGIGCIALLLLMRDPPG